MLMLYRLPALAAACLACISVNATIITYDYDDPITVRSDGGLEDSTLYINLETGQLTRRNSEQDGPYVFRVSYGSTATNPTIGIIGLGSESGISGRYVTAVRLGPDNIFNTGKIRRLEEDVPVEADLTGSGFNLDPAWFNDGYGYMGFKLEGGELDGALGYVEITYAGEQLLVHSISLNSQPGEPITTGEKGPPPPEIEIAVNPEGTPYVTYVGTLQYSFDLKIWHDVFPDPENTFNPYPVLDTSKDKFFRAVNQ